MRRIEILAYPDVQLLDVSGPLQVFASANDFRTQAGEPAVYELVVVAGSPRIKTSAGLVLETTALPAHGLDIDTLIVPGGWGVNAACEDPELIDWVAGRSRDAVRTASVCSGAMLLAEAGLLDGRRAVTHWGRCAEFARRFPAVRLEPDPIFIRDGNVWTSAGVTAGIDLALSFVEADLGRRMALAVARELVVFLKRPGGQAQFSQTLKLQEGDGRFDRLHGWILDNLDGDLSLAQLADHANMSLRSFSRHYQQATGRTPARAIEEIRIEAARRMLERGQTVRQTARRCGFGSEETMRRGFLRVLGTNPRDYRERF
ncbi:Transcriptional regulator GlxA family, contains an amidase domain and an AraC-type DNA-binding HTH domain [Mesorhizobium sp. NFR06]|jgi:transcriptional regulator GlxA family with amidase domain|uniref:GlxA family transcriptional regulator n=1 Tax=Mesorhizobium sp. NFR06 TaxID=1566290 RepID=UPI0008ECF480|nr:GlxA family transcriptional regulator [Mesorhizobium sp. NFR06]SFN69012.1 Transcriptional regulator GlxA family, contains an amidase domain and an AraC-type DNA-binding HTH domain [Mesorhizobium sp. NFR06]